MAQRFADACRDLGWCAGVTTTPESQPGQAPLTPRDG